MRNVEWMLCELLNCNRALLYAYPERMLSDEEWVRFQEMLARRSRHEPLQYILGYTSFCGLRIAVTPQVLIPRPETERLFEIVLSSIESLPSPRVLDICTGSGCLPVAIKHFYPKSEVYACDISPEALAIAESNAVYHKAPIHFFLCDILHKDPPIPDNLLFDTILSNPPYIPSEEYATLDREVRLFEPELALNAGSDPLLFYRSISRKATEWLKPGGALFLETHCDYASDVADLLRRYGFIDVIVDDDLAGLPRIVQGIVDNKLKVENLKN